MKFIQRFTQFFSAIGQVVTIELPGDAEEVALRILAKYDIAQPPPTPEIVLIVVANNPATLNLASVKRNFMMVSNIEPLPDNFMKYIATVPFGPEKATVHLIEISGEQS